MDGVFQQVITLHTKVKYITVKEHCKNVCQALKNHGFSTSNKTFLTKVKSAACSGCHHFSGSKEISYDKSTGTRVGYVICNHPYSSRNRTFEY